MVSTRNKEYKGDNLELSVKNLSRAIFVVNKHAKTAIDPRYLYNLKKKALEKLLVDGKAVKIGLHFSKNSRFSRQNSTVLISCGAYLFHLSPLKDDFQTLKHLGHLNDEYRNPKTYLSLKQAKALLIAYTGLKEHQSVNPILKHPNTRNIYPHLLSVMENDN